MSMVTDALWAFWKIVCLSSVVFSLFCSIMIFSVRSETGDLTKVVGIFLAASLPKFFSLFSSGESGPTLEKIDMERRLETVITRYAEGNCGIETTNEESSSIGMQIAAQTSYGSMSTTAC